MSGINVVTKTLLADATVAGIVGTRVYPIDPDQNGALPHIVVNLIGEPDEDLLTGAAKYPESRISVETRADNIPQLLTLSQAVIDALQDKTQFPIAGCVATIRKEGTDVTDGSQQRQPGGGPYVVRRITDFYVYWRRA